MRLNAYLARTGIASRRGADELIKRGRIRVNGVTAGLSTYVKEGDVVDLVGRLDADTTGVLLLTNDGDLAHRLAHPRYEVEKVYEAEVEGEPSDEALAALEQGLDLHDG